MLRWASLASAAAALALGLVACGGVGNTLDPVAAAADKSANAGGVRMHIDASFTAAGSTSSFSAEGVFDDDEGELTMDMSQLLGAAAGPVGEMKVLVTKEDGDAVVYVHMAELAQFVPGGKSWMKLNVEELVNGMGLGAQANGLMGAAGQTPAQMLDLLRKVGSVTEVGTESIDGAETTHYRALVDLVEALENAGAPPAAAAAVTASGLSTQVPIDVWIGVDDGYVHRVRITYETTADAQSVSGELTITMSDWGTDVSIEKPGADEVFDATALVAGLSKS